eukprot:2283361-Heterocapsa_arctica.AAC.1
MQQLMAPRRAPTLLQPMAPGARRVVAISLPFKMCDDLKMVLWEVRSHSRTHTVPCLLRSRTGVAACK